MPLKGKITKGLYKVIIIRHSELVSESQGCCNYAIADRTSFVRNDEKEGECNNLI